MLYLSIVSLLTLASAVTAAPSLKTRQDGVCKEGSAAVCCSLDVSLGLAEGGCVPRMVTSLLHTSLHTDYSDAAPNPPTSRADLAAQCSMSESSAMCCAFDVVSNVPYEVLR